jgi:hypothetical protein
MSLESAEKLVERILRELGVQHRVEETAEKGGSRIVVDKRSLEALPAELQPYVTAQETRAPAEDDENKSGGDTT